MLTHNYIPIMQKPYCCGIACLLMVVYRHTGRLYDQEWLAREFSVKIGDRYAWAFGSDMPRYTSLTSNVGIETLSLSEQINTWFGNEQIGLTAIPVKASAIKDLTLFIHTHLFYGDDLWCEYVSGDISDITGSSHRSLHDGLIQSCDGDTIIMIDPEPECHNKKEMQISDLRERISWKYAERETGFLIIKKV